MPRIEPITEQDADLITRRALKESTKRIKAKPQGRHADSISVSAKHKGVLFGQIGMELALERSNKLPQRVKALVDVRAAQVVGCEFCMDIGSFLARGHEVSEEDLRDLTTYRASDRFSEAEKLALDWATALSRTPEETTDDLYARLREHFDEQQVIELSAVIAWENFRARFNAAAGLGAQGFTEGTFCVPPADVEALASS